MKTKHLSRLVPVLLALLLALAGCDLFDDDAPYLSRENPFMDPDPISAVIYEGDGAFYFEATGAMEDEGTVRGEIPYIKEFSNFPGEWSGVLVLEGVKGEMSLEVTIDTNDPADAEGSFTIIGGTDTYEFVRGGGDVRATVGATGSLWQRLQGTCYEVQ